MKEIILFFFGLIVFMALLGSLDDYLGLKANEVELNRQRLLVEHCKNGGKYEGNTLNCY